MMGVLTQLRVFRKCNGTENNYLAQWDRVINNIKHFKVNQTSKLWSWFKNHSILPQIFLGRGTWPSYFWPFRIYGFLPFSVVLKAVNLLFSFCSFFVFKTKAESFTELWKLTSTDCISWNSCNCEEHWNPTFSPTQ